MTEPTSTLDTRFSDPNAVAANWDETRRALETADIFWISTVRADGRPHVTPLVAVWMDDAVHFTTGAAEQKACNLRGNPHVILTTGCNRWQEGLDVVVEGTAVEVHDEEILGRLAALWATKWDGRWQWHVGGGGFTEGEGEGEGGGGGGGGGGDPVVVYSVAPDKVLAFARGVFGHTRHRF
jgi:nitroimidazol reductase NimA-like FMN-containing flavoprotein (pyridoxamine 5'-phosphate oxidase superfamily)